MRRALGLLALAMLLLPGLVPYVPGAHGQTTADPAPDTPTSLGQSVTVAANSRNVVKGESVAMDVAFGPAGTEQVVTVTCEGCTIWEARIRWSEDKQNCLTNNVGNRFCRISFPEQFREQGTGARPEDAGEPSRRATYHVSINEGARRAERDEFNAWLSSTYTCRDQIATRSDIILISTSGHPAGEAFTLTLKDLDNNRVLLERSQNSAGRHIAYHYLYEVPLDYDLGGNQWNRMEVRVESASRDEVEPFTLHPAFPLILRYANPGEGGQPVHFERTTDVRYHFSLVFGAAPEDCRQVSWQRRIIPVTEDMLQLDHLRGRVRQIETVQGVQNVVTEGNEIRAHFAETGVRFMLNYTIPRDAKATRESAVAGQPGSPEYLIHVPRQLLEGGNYVREFNSSFYRVRPVVITPAIEVFERDVERLEQAEIVFNITYKDGSPLTETDLSSPLEVEFRDADEGTVREVYMAEEVEPGLWRVAFDVPWEWEDLGEYTWHLRENRDRHGDPDMKNTIAERTSDPFKIVGARPLIDLKTFVGEDETNVTERTRTVHVTLTARYKNGIPLTTENVDPSLGGVVLNVKKKNAQGRILDVDSMVMTDADGAGAWVRTFRIGRSADEAPTGDWDLEIVARNNRDPVDENVTSFPLEVVPARISVTPVREPADLIQGGEINYDVRLTYPDGSLFIGELADEARGARVNARLERVNFLGENVVEDLQRPRPLEGGQVWRATIDAETLVPGAHFFNVSGEDIHGNVIGPHTGRLFTVLFNGEFRNSTTPICPASAGSTPCNLPRGSDVFVLFPKSEGDKGFFGPTPLINVFRQLPGEDRWVVHKADVTISGDDFFELTGRDAGENHIGHFKTDETTPAGRYVLFILGRSVDDHGFAGYSSQFNITAITVDRAIVRNLPSLADKGETLTAIIQKEPGDVIDSAVVRAGPVTSRAVRVTPTALGTFAQWTPDRTTPTGPATIEVLGRDLFGNQFRALLGPVELRPLPVRVEVQTDPAVEVGRGTIARAEARLFFPDGLAYTSRHGTPDVRIVGPDDAALDEGVARFFGGRWFFDWSPPHDFPVSEVQFAVTGRDPSGNTISDWRSRPFRVVPGEVTPIFPRSPPDAIERGAIVRTIMEFPSPVTNVTAAVSTGSSDLGEATVEVAGRSVRLSFPTDRTTPLVLARFEVTGKDIHGNDLDGQSQLFRINPQAMRVRFLQQPPIEVEKGTRVISDFVVEYPDGSRLRQGQGVPIVGLFARDRQLGPIEAKPLNNDPTVWRVAWDPPPDVLREVPYRFVVASLDRWQNEALPVSTRGFFVADPLVPDYLPIPWASPVTILALAALLAALLGRHRRD